MLISVEVQPAMEPVTILKDDSDSRPHNAGFEEVHTTLEDDDPHDRFCIVHEVQEDRRHRSTDDDHPVFLLIKVLVHDPAADGSGQEGSNEWDRCEIADCFQIDAAFCDEVGRHPGIETFIDAGNTECAKDEFPDQGELQEVQEVFILLALILFGFFLRLGLLDKERIEEYIDKTDDTKDLEHTSPSEPENQRHDDDWCHCRADIVRRKDPRGKCRTQLTREVFGDRAVAGSGIRSFAKTEDEPKEKQARQSRCMPCREGEDGPQRQRDKDDRL